MLSIKAQLEKQKTLADFDTLKEKVAGRLSDKRLNQLISMGINPFNRDGSLKTKNCLSVMLWRYKNKNKWYKTKGQNNGKQSD